ncbi:hypothetical protein K438DRAFT_1955297 [Mycena galopus ATCC 62051]|nr:hypothetical protein K438DRAFT_1955297 [Mycena galopus ATCC 62051]
MAPMSPTYGRLEAGTRSLPARHLSRSVSPSLEGKNRFGFGWKKFALGASALSLLVWVFVLHEQLLFSGYVITISGWSHAVPRSSSSFIPPSRDRDHNHARGV